jgi:hypothetical protein
VNVSKDSWRDAQEGRTYLPEAFLPTPEFPERIDAVLLLAASRLDRGSIRGYILKRRSPSCGMERVKI